MKYVGAAVRRVEDPRLVRGAGEYVADIPLPGSLYAGFVRSPLAHADIRSIDLGHVRAMPGVVAAFDAHDLPDLGRLTRGEDELPDTSSAHQFSPLAVDRVRYAGEPVAVVLAEDPYVLTDAVEAALVDYEERTPVIDPEAAETSPAIWDDAPGNVVERYEMGFGDVEALFASADVVVEGRFAMERSAGAAMEPRVVTAAPGGEDGIVVTIWDSTQAPHNVRDQISAYLRLEPDVVRVITPDVGGGFGVKGRIYPEEYAVAALALHLNRPVRFVATRTEDLMTTCQGRGQIQYARLAARGDGTIVALDTRILQDAGAYAPSGLTVPFNSARHSMGPYKLEGVRVRVTGVYTNKVMTSPLRGGGRPQGIYVMERLLDRLADTLALDRAEIRRRNFIPPEAFPYDTRFPTGPATVVYDSGNFPAYLERALEAMNWPELRRQQAEARAAGRYLGLGVIAFIESTGAGSEGARMTVRDDGTVDVVVGSPPQGQGHATAFAQMAAERLGVPIESVRYSAGDTAALGWGTGTFASRMGMYAGNAVSLASQAVRERALELAGEMLEIAPADLDLIDGRIEVRGVPGRGIDLGEVAAEAARRGEPLREERPFAPRPMASWAGGVNACLVEVDVETGKVEILRFLVVHDSGKVINPTIVEGQIHGGVAHGTGNALYEQSRYNDEGQPLTATFADYDVPGIGEAPTMAIEHFETPSPYSPEGIKGAGEGGTIGAIPAIVSAVEDALSPFGIQLSDVPLSPERIVRMVQARRK